MAKARTAPFHSFSPSEARALYTRGCEVLEVPKPHLARVEDFTIPSFDGAPLPARLYANAAKGVSGLLPALLYTHGGGFVIGSVDTHDTLCRELAYRSGCAVVSLDYRLAPEHTFPTAANDAWAALQWLRQHADTLGLDATRLAVGGDSAGGTLAAQSALRARDAGLPLVMQLLIYPGVGARQGTATHREFAEGYGLDFDTVAWFFHHYLPNEADHDDWRFAPLLAPDHAGLAPAWIALAECDPLFDEGIAYGDVLRAAGVPVDLEVYRGVIHGFVQFGRALKEARQFHIEASQALKTALLNRE